MGAPASAGSVRWTITLDGGVGALFAVVLVGGYDYLSLRELSVPVAEALRVCAAASLSLALVIMLLLALSVRLGARWLQRSWAELNDDPARVGARSIIGLLTLLALGAVTYGGLAGSQRAFTSPEVQRLAVTLVVVALAVTIGVTRASLLAALERRLGSSGRPLALSISMLLMLLVGGLGLLLLGGGSTQLRPLLSATLIAVAALSMSVLSALGVGGERRMLRWARGGVVLVSVCAIAVIAWTGTVPRSRALLVALDQRPTMSTLIFRQLYEGGRHLPRPAEPSSDHSAVCTPHAAPPRAEDVGKATADAPDIIVITVDALRWDHTTMGGYERDTTPQMNAHAGAAAVFERAYSPASSTRQTLRALLSGVHSSLVRYRQNTWKKWGVAFHPEQVTFAEYFRAAGYETIAISASASLFAASTGAVDGFSIVDERPARVHIMNDHSADEVVDRIIERLDGERERPRLIWTHILEPHQPYDRPADSLSFGDEEVDRYDGAIHWTDQQLGRLLEHIRSGERSEQTYLFVSADHGQAFGEHASHHHGTTVYEEQIHIPLLVWGPGVVGQRISTPVSILDLLPTALALAGLEIPPPLCGRNLQGALEGEDLAPRPIYVENVPDHTRAYFSVAFIDGDLKVVLKPTKGLRELYRLDSDPHELDDLAVDEAELLQLQLDKVRELQLARGLNPAAYGLDP